MRIKHIKRYLLVIVLIMVANVGGYLIYKLHCASRQREVVELIRACGGEITYDYQLDAKGLPVSDTKFSAPRWLVRLLGVDFFARVVEVDGGARLSDNDMSLLPNLKSVRAFYLTGNNKVSNVGLSYLSDLDKLSFLYIKNFHVQGYSKF